MSALRCPRFFACEDMRFACAALFTLCLQSQSEADNITLTNGKCIDCNIKQVSFTTLTAEAENSTTRTPEVLWINLAEVKIVSLSGVSPELVQAEPTAENLARLKAFWTAMHPLVGKPGNQIAHAGLRLAVQAVAKNTLSVGIEEALEIVRRIKTAAIEAAHRIEAQALEMRILAELGRFEDARAECQKWEDPRFPLTLRVSAKLTAGICGHEEMRVFLFENPRWREDFRVHKERSEIYERTMDGYIFAALFSGEKDSIAQAALYHAARFLILCGEQSQAISIASTLRRRFQESAYAKTIEDEIKRAKQAHPVTDHQGAHRPSCLP